MRRTPLLVILVLAALGGAAAAEPPVVVVEDGPIALPQDGRVIRPAPARSRPIIVEVRNVPGQQAAYAIDGQPIALAALGELLGRARERDPDQQVVINGDLQVSWEQVAAAMSACAAAGITRVSATVSARAPALPDARDRPADAVAP